MKIFRAILPLYKRLIKDSSRGKGYGKNKFVRKILSFFDLLFRGNEVEVHGHKMFLTKKGFEEYSTQGLYGKFDTQAVESLIKPGDYVIDIANHIIKNHKDLNFDNFEDISKIITIISIFFI